MRNRLRMVMLGGCVCLMLLSGAGHSLRAVEPATIRLALDGISLEGTPLAWSGGEVLLLERNGFLWQFAPDKAQDYRQLANVFRPYSQSEMRGQLLREFGKRFDVSGTGNYLVVHPAGERDLWAQRFEDLFRSFVHYFSTRGMRPAAPQFPLVAIVFPSQAEFMQYVAQIGGVASPNIAGFYSPRSNRVILFDVARGQASEADWHLNAETIIHEATHQMAFNTNVHSRAAIPPRWAGEGLAMLFEAPGVWDARHHPHLQDRVNRMRLTAFQQYARTRRPDDSLPLFISSSERLFASVPSIAYAEAWALTFFLSEKEPGRYIKYLARTAAREPLKTYGPDEQLREFTDVFGSDLKMLEARYLRFIEQL